MGTRWKLKKEALREAIVSAPESLSQSEFAAWVSRELGIEVTYDSVQSACYRHLGSTLGDLRAKVVMRSTSPDFVGKDDHVVIEEFPSVEQAINTIPVEAKPPNPTNFVAPTRDLLVFASGDWHVPYHDPLSLRVFLEATRRMRPDVLVLMGDILDCYSLSTFSKDPRRKVQFSDELSTANKVLDLVQDIGIEKVYFIEGNHEFRLERFVMDNPKAAGLLEMRELLGIDERGWTWVPYKGASVQIGTMHFKHDVGPAGRYANQQSIDAFGNNICFGHTHRGGHELRNTVSGETHQALNTGWLGDWQQADYNHVQKSRREYVNGFGSVRIDGETGAATCAFHPILNGQVVIDGKVIRAA